MTEFIDGASLETLYVKLGKVSSKISLNVIEDENIIEEEIHSWYHNCAPNVNSDTFFAISALRCRGTALPHLVHIVQRQDLTAQRLDIA